MHQHHGAVNKIAKYSYQFIVGSVLEWENAGKKKLLSVGYSLRAPELLFTKIEDDVVQSQIEKLRAKSSATNMQTSDQPSGDTAQPSPLKPEIVFEDFSKIDLKTGTIISAEKVEKADKLLKLEIDLGFEKRTIVSGIALHFTPEEIVGRQVTVVANLAPRKMRGIESNGMILMAEDNNGKLYFISPDQAINNGSPVT
jgi:methionyl-tRNA synthetase